MVPGNEAPTRIVNSRFRPPQRQLGSLERPRLVSSLEHATRRDHNTLVVAPSGYGKTSAVSEWASHHEGRVAWLTLLSIDNNALRIGSRNIQALQSLWPEPENEDLRALREIPFTEHDLAEQFDQLCSALTLTQRPVYLVIDDTQKVVEHINSSLIEILFESGAPNLKVILIGTSSAELSLSRFAMNHPEQVIRASELAFDVEEIEQILPENYDVPSDLVLQQTHGWPLALRFLSLSGSNPVVGAEQNNQLLAEYFQSHLLKSLPPRIAELAIATSVCEYMTADMAKYVSRITDAKELLEEAVRLDVFIDSFDSTGQTVYRWHPVFADRCRAVLESRSPGAVVEALRRSAEHSEIEFSPLQSASYALKAGDVEKSLQVVCDHWINMLVGPDCSALNQLLTDLPHPHNNDPRALLIRACVQEVQGERESAQHTYARARSIAQKLPDLPVGYDSVLLIANVLMLDNRNELAQATEALFVQLKEPELFHSASRAGVEYLIGLAGLRHRSNPELTLELLANAFREAKSQGELALADRSLATLSLALAWAGQLSKAGQVLTQRELAADDPTWLVFAGGSADVAQGYVCFWANELDTSMKFARKAFSYSSSPFMFAGAGRFLFALAAAAKRDLDACKQSTKDIEAMPETDVRGINWSAWRHLALASLHEATGNRETALKILAHYEHVENLPFVSSVFAGIAMRLGQPERAVALMQKIDRRYQHISYVRVVTNVAEAVMQRKLGHIDEAMNLLQESTHVAKAENIRRPYAGFGLDLRQLVNDYTMMGGANSEFLVECLSANATKGPLDTLSERERAVLAEMRTPKTVGEIAEALNVSVNTVKSHQRAIYRKLGVPTRREAVRISL